MSDANPYANANESFIICIDDDHEFLNSLKISLPTKFSSESNYNLLFLDNPLETLEIVKELVDDGEEIALILTDQMMPHMKGIDFLKEAREHTPNTMRVLLTGHAGMDSAIVAINENVLHRYLTKPVVDINELVFTLKHLLNEFHLKSTVDNQQRIILDLYNFSNTLNSFEKLDQILDHTVSFIRNSLQSDRVSILMLEDEELSIKAGSGIPEDVVGKVRIPLGENVAGKVLQNKEAMLVKDINNIPWLEPKINTSFTSFMSAPVICADLSSSNVPLGVVNVTNKRDNQEFTEHDLRTLSFIANTASIAINNNKNKMALEKNYFDTIKALIVALEARDEYTKGHSVRVMEYSEAIAKKLGLTDFAINKIKDAAILHDIGKIGIRDAVLLKPGRLDDSELAIIQEHPSISNNIIETIDSLREVGRIVKQHHEKFDGSGYPNGLKGEDIHLGARIMAVADAYDAMTSQRPYRKSLDKDFVLKELEKNAGIQFDPNCVKAFLTLETIMSDDSGGGAEPPSGIA